MALLLQLAKVNNVKKFNDNKKYKHNADCDRIGIG